MSSHNQQNKDGKLKIYGLLPAQQDDLFNTIIITGLDPDEFEWTRQLVTYKKTGSKYYISSLQHKGFKYKFSFLNTFGFASEYNPSGERNT